jgi:hypothetical protein
MPAIALRCAAARTAITGVSPPCVPARCVPTAPPKATAPPRELVAEEALSPAPAPLLAFAVPSSSDMIRKMIQDKIDKCMTDIQINELSISKDKEIIAKKTSDMTEKETAIKMSSGEVDNLMKQMKILDNLDPIEALAFYARHRGVFDGKTKGWTLIKNASAWECRDNVPFGKWTEFTSLSTSQKKETIEYNRLFGYTEMNALADEEHWAAQYELWERADSRRGRDRARGRPPQQASSPDDRAAHRWWPRTMAKNQDDIINNTVVQPRRQTYVKPGATIVLLKEKELSGFEIIYDKLDIEVGEV